MINKFDFEFEGSPDDVGMQTGATIHTMNGLRMRLRRVSENESLPATDGWWEKQHLKRGLSASGRPYESTKLLENQHIPIPERPADPGNRAAQ